MATEKFTAATSRGNILSTELNSLAAGEISAPGTELDNSSNKDIWAIAVLSVDFATGPTVYTVCQLYAVITMNGTDYEQGGATAGGIDPPETGLLATFQMDNTNSAQLVNSNRFRLRGPFKHKFLLRNRTNQAFPSSGSTVALYTFNRDLS